MFKFENHFLIGGFPFPHRKPPKDASGYAPVPYSPPPIFLGVPFVRYPSSRKTPYSHPNFSTKLPHLLSIISDSTSKWFPLRSPLALSPSGFLLYAIPQSLVLLFHIATSSNTCPSLLIYSSSVLLHIGSLPLRLLQVFILCLTAQSPSLCFLEHR